MEESQCADDDALTLTDSVTDTGVSNVASPADDERSLTSDVDNDLVRHEVPFKNSDVAEQSNNADDNSSSVQPVSNDMALTDNSNTTSVKTEDSTSNDCVAAETDQCSSLVDKDETRNGLHDDEPVVLALNLTKDNVSESNSEVSPQNVAKTFVIVENNDSGDDSMDAPIDLSRGPKLPHRVIVNGSEFEAGGSMVNGIDYHDDGVLKVADMSAIRKYQEELRNEETKLVLLKKIRHSQAVHRLVNDSVNAKHSSSSSSSSTMISQSLSGPPPLVRGGFQSSTTASHRTGVHQGSTEMPRLYMQPGATHTQSAHHSAHAPPPLVMAARQSSVVTSANRSTSSTSLTSHSQTPVHSYRPTPPSQSPAPEQTAAQRQAAAKLALRRQLEKTLLQIPPPKPPPPEMNFIPNINMNAEFVMLVGLEEAVKCIVDTDTQTNTDAASADVKYVFTPFECVQCQTDFTPVWKRDRPGSKAVICERCVTTNQKRALKQEHTNRLKGAFVRALQQEQEIEQSLLAGVTSGSSTPPPTQPLVTSSSRTSAGSVSVKAGTESSRHYQGMSSYLSAPNLRSTPGSTVAGMSLPSAAAAAFTASRLMFPYQQGIVPSTTSRSSSSMDLPRQFLLDMIPRRAPVDGQALWRT